MGGGVIRAHDISSGPTKEAICDRLFARVSLTCGCSLEGNSLQIHSFGVCWQLCSKR